MTYKESGVDIKKNDLFKDYIKNINSKYVVDIGKFAGGVYNNLIDVKIISTTDGVGTKILVAKELSDYSTIGIDLVAVNVNDILVCGAFPISFLDYIAYSNVENSILKDIINGIIKGCEMSKCPLVGGETAEMPDLYKSGDLDLAGFCNGIVYGNDLLPKKEEMEDGDILLAIPSTGVHSNGLTLARKVIPLADVISWKKLLVPTKIYFNEMSSLFGKIKGAAHITGGGIEGNLSRIIPFHLKPSLSNYYKIPEIFSAIQDYGKITDNEMYKVFNMGVGIICVVDKDEIDKIDTNVGFVIGKLVSKDK